MGAKRGVGRPIPGHLDIAAFYNGLSNQQLSVVFIPKTASVSIAEGKVNAGRSLTDGVEIDLGLQPASGLNLTLGYSRGGGPQCSDGTVTDRYAWRARLIRPPVPSERRAGLRYRV
jgi:hypothetical protein